MERYRSGHNGTDSKSVGGAIPTWVRTPPSPPFDIYLYKRRRLVYPVAPCFMETATKILERCPSGRRSTPGKCVYGNVSRVRIPPSPPNIKRPRRGLFSIRCQQGFEPSMYQSGGSTNRQDCRLGRRQGRRPQGEGPWMDPRQSLPLYAVAWRCVSSRHSPTHHPAIRCLLPNEHASQMLRLRYYSSVRCSFGGQGNLANGQEHSDGLGSIVEGATDQVNRYEAQRRIKGNCTRFGIHDHTDATDAVSHLQSKFKHGAQ